MESITDKLNYINKHGRVLLKLIQENGPLSKSQLIQLTKMKLSTLNRAIQPLVDENLIIETEVGQSTGGRRPVLYDINPIRYYIVGVDISRTYIQIVITNFKMRIISQNLLSLSGSPEETVKLISGNIDEMMRKLSIDKPSILGIGIGTVGPINRQKGIMTTPQNFPAKDWVNVPLKKMMELETGLPVLIDNGANAAVLAEYLFGMGKGLDNIVYFNCGVGIRTGAINSGAIIRTINNSEDVFGHMVIDVDGEACSCGNYGCIECYSSILAITKKFTSEIKKGRISLLRKPIDEISYIDICRAAEENDEVAKEVIINAATIFGTGLANYINLLSPKLIILSGPLIKHSQLFYDTCTEIAFQKCYLKKENGIFFSKGGHFQDYAMAVGAAVEVIDKIFRN